MRYTCAIFAVLILTGCSDVVTTRFATLADAKSQGAFERGWLPPIMPDSARSIVESNDLDVNTGTGSFTYDLSEKTSYVKRLLELGASSQVEGDTDVLALKTNGNRWEIQLPHVAGQASWKMQPSSFSARH